ncbi:MAG: hypothetical protein HC895_13095 [Leptolyngbyaceae cyanobacterium SM1_3_5]|nr:hypothetical protein [Leptolyngbyaceae cyanobacterium SM1_3_5]
MFNDRDFLAAHGSLPLSDRVRNTTDPRWRGDRYPEGFPTDPNQQTIIHEADFFKFRGRGLIQTTFRSAYRHLIEYIRDNAIAHPVLEDYRRRWTGQNSDRIATMTTNANWDRLFLETDWIVPVLGVRLHSRHSGNYLNMPLDAAVLNGSDRGSIYFVGRRISGSPRYGRLFRQRVMQMLNALGNGATP